MPKLPHAPVRDWCAVEPGIDPDARSEIIQRRIPALDFHGEVFSDLDRFGALVIGPGLGREEGAIASARELIADATLPVVIDGDGIFVPRGAPMVRRRCCAPGAGRP